MRKAILGIAGATALAAGSTAANATTFIGGTQGCFGAACVPGASATTGGLSFTGGSFNQADSNGFLAIGSSAENLGYFSLGGTPLAYNTLFSLLVTFTSPAGTTPSSGSYSATITGSVTSSNNGGVSVNFDNTPQNFTYTGGGFSLFVNDLGVNAGGERAIVTGVIQAVPEPATWALMLLGFGGIGLALRRRRRPALAQLA